MAKLHITREEHGQTVTLRLQGTFDGEAAGELARRLGELGTAEVVVDFSLVKEFLDLAVPVVIRALHERRCQLKGLVRHQERVFRYFGLRTVEDRAAL